MTFSLKAKCATLVTILVALSACSHRPRKLVDQDEHRVVPMSEFGPGESWRDQEDSPTQYASTKESFRERLKKSNKTRTKSSVASQR